MELNYILLIILLIIYPVVYYRGTYARSLFFDKPLIFGNKLFMFVSNLIIILFVTISIWLIFVNWKTFLLLILIIATLGYIKGLLNKNNDEKRDHDTYEFINNAGGKEVVTIGYDDTEKCDIYWEDIVASKDYNENYIDTSIDEEEALNLINKKCPFCDGIINRFYFESNEKRESQYTGWMEVCLKCKKPIYFKVEVMDKEIIM